LKKMLFPNDELDNQFKIEEKKWKKYFLYFLLLLLLI
jgi:hypothetical protein